MNLLILEDESELSQNISNYLLQNLYQCETAMTFNAAREKLAGSRYDCIILDIGLPVGSGLELLRQLKQQKLTDGVLIISANNSLNDKIEGLELGRMITSQNPFIWLNFLQGLARSSEGELLKAITCSYTERIRTASLFRKQ